MISSMTGYGCAQGQLDGVTYIVELRSVNSRYFKSRIKLPETLVFLEEDIEKLLQDNLSRGTVNCVIRLRNAPAEALFDVDEAALARYLEILERAASSIDIKCPIDIAGLLALPGIVVPAGADPAGAEKLKEKILAVTGEAIDQVRQMRAAEGAALEADLEVQCEAINRHLEQIRSRSQDVKQEYHKKLRGRVDELLADGKIKLDESTLAREVAVFADRSDVSEEIARLDSHLRRFNESCRADGQSGRRLDFIGQEMLREANTIASKASDTEIINHVVDMKCRIDRIKEQVQNIE